MIKVDLKQEIRSARAEIAWLDWMLIEHVGTSDPPQAELWGLEGGERYMVLALITRRRVVRDQLRRFVEGDKT